MCIRSTQPIITTRDINDTEIVFNVMPDDTVEADPFSPDYNPEFKKEGSRPWMKWSTFRKVFMNRFGLDAELWAADKMVLSEDEVYGMQQTTNGYVWRLTFSKTVLICISAYGHVSTRAPALSKVS